MPQQKPRLEPRMVFAVAVLVIPLLYVVAHVIIVRTGDDCSGANQSQVGSPGQMLVPGDGCTQPLPGR